MRGMFSDVNEVRVTIRMKISAKTLKLTLESLTDNNFTCLIVSVPGAK